MGPLALGGTALLWLVSVPLIAIGVVRWMFSRDNKSEYRPLAYLEAGYLRQLFLAVIYLVVSTFAFLAAAFVCSVYILGSVVLWFRGLYGVWQWYVREKQTPGKGKVSHEELGKGAVMPGARGVDGKAWEYAKGVVETLNISHKETSTGTVSSGHSDVELLLHMTTGWGLDHLSSLVRRQKEEELEAEGRIFRQTDDRETNVCYFCSAAMEKSDTSPEPTKGKGFSNTEATKAVDIDPI